MENKKQKDFCQTREVQTLACSDIGGLALTFDLAIVFAPPRPACGHPPLRRPWFWEQQEGREEHVRSVKRTMHLVKVLRKHARAFARYSSCAQFFADALVRFQFSMFADGVACVQKRAHPDLNQGPADLQSAALTTELCTQLQRGRCHPLNRF